MTTTKNVPECFVTDKWVAAALADATEKLHPIMLEKLAVIDPVLANQYRDEIFPANKLNLYPNLAPLLAQIVNHAVAVAVEKHQASIANLPGRNHISIDLNVIGQNGAQVSKVAEYDDKGRIKRMITEPLQGH